MTKKQEKQKLDERTLKMTNFLDMLSKENVFKNVEVNLFNNISKDVVFSSTGSLVLDGILGGGFPVGRIIEIYGPESSGKTSIALTAMGKAQKQGLNCMFVDVEQAFDPKYARKLGVDTNRLAFTQTPIAEDVLNLVYKTAASGVVDMIIVDSIAAMIPKEELEKDAGQPTMAVLARLLNTGLKKIVDAANKNKCTVIFINQIRDNIGVMYGPKTSTPGGRAMKFYASQRIEVKKVGPVQGDDKKAIGTEVNLKCIKNKVAPPYGEGRTVLTFAKGINTAAEIMVMSESYNVVQREGRTYWLTPGKKDKEMKFDDNCGAKYEKDRIKIATSSSAFLKELENNQVLREYIENKVAETIKFKVENGELEYSDDFAEPEDAVDE